MHCISLCDGKEVSLTEADGHGGCSSAAIKSIKQLIQIVIYFSSKTKWVDLENGATHPSQKGSFDVVFEGMFVWCFTWMDNGYCSGQAGSIISAASTPSIFNKNNGINIRQYGYCIKPSHIHLSTCKKPKDFTFDAEVWHLHPNAIHLG